MRRQIRADAVWLFLVWFTKWKHARLEQEKIFPITSWFGKSTDKWRCSASDAEKRVLSLRSIANSMRRHISSRRCSALSCLIYKSKAWSFRAGKDLSNDILVLKIDRQMTLQCLWRCRAASVFDQSRNRSVGKLRADAVWLFLARFTKAKYARLEQEKIFPATFGFEHRPKNDAAVPVQITGGDRWWINC